MASTAHISEAESGNLLEFDLHGKLGGDDYERFVPQTEKLIRQHGKIRILVTMHGFLGWDAGALWKDVQWNARHFNQIERMAIVGERTFHRLLTGVCRPFATAAVRYFPLDELSAARAWVKG